MLAVMPKESIATQPAIAIDREQITRTYKLIRAHVRRTPVIEVDGADFGLPGISIVLKLELLQHSGSFKARGAMTGGFGRESRRSRCIRGSSAGCPGSNFRAESIVNVEDREDSQLRGGIGNYR